ncbi:magnesium transporter NIPA-domain-containing protein [Podospora fimiseda]|uniref:Magnesium transporter NIPA-domain-containing protein n=1 Tax=Podospora fimiseda TaxID=252190 RepID=A0AAN7BEJ9_9PEZI|nr:magnesium transporter NIPA-domain-containing protein [Podospora fimiseda]
MHLPPPPHALSERNWPSWLPSFSSGDPDNPDGGDKELQNWSSLIGIITAICGNVLIALALNVQRYAHIRLHRHRAAVRERARQALKNAQRQTQGTGIGGYGAAGTSSTNGLVGHGIEDEDGHESSETDPLAQSLRSDDSRWSSESESEDSPKVASSYLQDPYWWLGQVLITVGEMGNFLAYGFAPASIVSPLGVVALVSNCVIAPIFFKEIFRVRDFWGVIIAIGGAVTVVLSAKTEETKMGPHEVWDAITTMEFEIYMGVSIGLIALLMYLSPRYGNRTILIDLGLVGLFGGYTALSTKGVSSMLSSTLLGAFTTPVTYVLLFILLSTAIMQVRFLNKALQRFDSTQVIPIQFVLFTLSVIIGSAVLYRDFERTNLEQAIKFVGGCLLTFFGVFLITSGRPPHDEEDEATLSDAEGIEETIGLASQERTASRQVGISDPHRRGSDSRIPGRPRRSSKVSFKEGMSSKLSVRVPQKQDFIDEENHEDAPLLGGPWRDSTVPVHPGLGVHTISSESVPSTVISDTPTERYDHNALISVTSATPEFPCTPPQPPLIPNTTNPGTNRPTTPAARLTHLAGGGSVISPSPFSSTLTAVIADTFLSHLDPTSSPSQTRSRPSLRNSLFVPQEGNFVDLESQQRGALSAIERRSDNHSHHHGGGLFGGYLDGSRSNETGRKGTIRGRARSLSHTLGGLFGVGSSSRPVVVRDRLEDGDGGQLERARTTGSGSTETL